MLRARTNSLKLNWRNRFTNNLECCPVCKQESEDLKHFLLLCPKYSTIRSQYEILQQPYNQVTEELIIQLLLIKQIEDSGQIEKKKERNYEKNVDKKTKIHNAIKHFKQDTLLDPRHYKTLSWNTYYNYNTNSSSKLDGMWDRVFLVGARGTNE